MGNCCGKVSSSNPENSKVIEDNVTASEKMKLAENLIPETSSNDVKFDVETKVQDANDELFIPPDTQSHLENKSSKSVDLNQNIVESPVKVTSSFEDSVNLLQNDSSSKKENVIYDNSKTIPIPELKGGYMSKQGQRFRTWVKRYFLLKEGVLSNFPTESASVESNVILAREHKQINLKGYTLESIPAKHQFILKSADPSPHSHYVLEVKNDVQYSLWENSLREHLAYANSRNN
jgi:hypothetical protein